MFNSKAKAGISLLILLFVLVFGLLIIQLFTTITISDAYGQIKEIEILSQVESKIVELNVQKDEPIKKGEILVQFDSKEQKDKIENLQKLLNEKQNELNQHNLLVNNASDENEKITNEINEAKNNLDSANSDYIRYKNAFKDGTVTKKDLKKASDNLEIALKNYNNVQKKLKENEIKIETLSVESEQKNNDFKNLEQEFNNAQLQYSYLTIPSMFDGFVVDVFVKNGDIVSKQQKLFSVVLNEIIIQIPEDIEKLEQGQKVVVQFCDNKKIDGIIKEIQKDNDIKLIISAKNKIKEPKTKQQVKIKVKI